MADKHDLARAFFIVTRSYPEHRFPSDSMTVFALQLQDMDGDLLLAAVLKACREIKFLPSVREIRKAAVDLIVEERPSSPGLAERLWIGEPIWSHLLPVNSRKELDTARAQLAAPTGGSR